MKNNIAKIIPDALPSGGMRVGILVSSKLFEAYSGADRLEEAAKKLGHDVVRLLERKLSFTEHDGRIVAAHDGQPLDELDVIIVRPNFVEEPSLHQYAYDMLRAGKYKLVNGGPRVSRSKNKFLQHVDLRGAGIPMPKWHAVYGVEASARAAETLGYPVILKLPFGTRGKGVFYADSPETLLPIADYLAIRDGNPVILEEFIREANGADVRAFVVGGEVIAGMELIAPAGEVRSNAGGKGQPVEMTDEERSLAVTAAKVMELDIAGVDILRSSRGPLVMEVNANPGFKELERVTGIDVAKKIVEFAVK